MRTRYFVCAALLATAATFHAGQDQQKKDNKPVIVVTGCIDGSWLQVQGIEAMPGANRYRLSGSKQLMKELRQYNHHLVEVTGAVTDTANTTHTGKTVQVGKKSRIYTGTKEATTVPTADAPSIDVRDYRNIKDSCG